jgi:hypothetical protein
LAGVEPLLGLVGLAGATVSLVQGRSGPVLLVSFCAVLLPIAVADLLVPADRTQAAVTDDVLRVGRGWKVSTIVRGDVRAVRGTS